MTKDIHPVHHWNFGTAIFFLFFYVWLTPELLAFCSLCSAMQLLATNHCLPVFQCFRQFLERK